MIPKRVFWFVTGAAGGVAAILRAQREIENPAQRTDPVALARAASQIGRETAVEMRRRLEGRT